MIIERAGFKEIVEKLRSTATLSLDLETTGLRPFHGDRILSAIVSDKTNSFYFNFWPYEGIGPEFILPLEWFEELKTILANKLIYMANPKFDLSFARPKDIEQWNIHDVLVVERLIKNDRIGKYSLQTVANEYGFKKSDAVEEYIDKHHLWEWVIIPGKKTRVKNKFFYKVPFQLMASYGEIDGRITFDTGEAQLVKLQEMNLRYFKSSAKRNIYTPLNYEKKLTPILWKMENKGVRIDTGYCEEAVDYLKRELTQYEEEFKTITGLEDFRDSPKFLAPVLEKYGVELGKTDKGNDQVDSKILKKSGLPVCDAILNWRQTSKRLNTYFRAFLYHADASGVVHTNFRQGGTKSGRMSSSDPNLQNQKSEDEIPDDSEDFHPYPIKKAFVPRIGRRFVELDYDQMEFRLMLMYAGQLDLMRKIMEEGLDPHQATADITGLIRKRAKTMNFACVAEGSLVLTSHGLKAIENVCLADLLWDGVEYVSHAGVVYQGEKDTYNFDGLRCTEDHIVFTEKGRQISAWAAATQLRNDRVFRAEIDGYQIRYLETSSRLYRERQKAFIYYRKLYSLLKRVSGICRKHFKKINENVQVYVEQENGSHRSNKNSSKKILGCPHKMLFKKSSELQKLWWTWNTCENFHRRLCQFFLEKLYRGADHISRCRSYRQRGPLRGGEFKVSDKVSELIKSKKKVKVYDILNCGPRNRFTASGYLVHNCLYGTGAGTIADMLGCTEEEAKKIKREYFEGLPMVEQFIRATSYKARQEKYTRTWDGRVHHFEDPRFSYKAVNYVIQGGCAGIAKQAMNKVDAALSGRGADMLLQVHDSLLIEFDEGKESLALEVKDIMESIYSSKEMRLTASVEFKKSSWHK